MRAKKPPRTYEPIVCPICLATVTQTRHLEKLWMDAQSLLMCCDSHGAILTKQYFDAIIAGKAE